MRAGNSEPQLLAEQVEQAEKAKQVTRKHLNSISTVLARVNSVLTGRRIKVNIVEQPSYKAPAWSSTSEMWLNLSEIKFDLSAHSILSLQGLSFHELSHLLYTVRNGHALPVWIREQDNAQELWESYNCLEDMRIETLLTGYLPTVENWLTATIVDYLLGNDEAVTTAFPLVYGRQYLPVELRQLAVDNYKQPNDIKALASIIDEYRLLIFASNDDTERAKELIVAFNNLLDNLPKQPNDNGNGDGAGEGCSITIRVHSPNGHGNRPVEGVESSSVRPAKTSQQKRDQQNAIANQKQNVVLDVVVKEKPAETSKDDTNKSDEGTGNSNKKSECGNVVQNEKTDNDYDNFDDDLETEFNDFDGEMSDEIDDTSSTTGGGKFNSNEQGVTGANQEITDVLNDVMKDIVDELSKEINRIAKQAGLDLELDGGNAKTPDKANYSNDPAPADLVLSSRAFARELERLRADHDPAWLKQTDNGKINAVRYLSGNDLDTCFDEWQSGRDDVTAIEAVILLDRSSSMQGRNANEAYKSMWAIKKALESVEATTTVVLFDSRTTLLYDKNDKAGTTIRNAGANGGTDPRDSILYAKKVLAESDKPIKLLCMITDGAWDSEAGEQAVTEMKNAGVLTCQALLHEGRNLSADYLNQVRHSFELVTQLQSAKDITTLGKSLVRLAIQRNLVK